MEVINVTYFDPAHSIFKGTGKDREYVRVFRCHNKNNCNAYKNGTCVLLNGLWGHSCPNGEVQKIEGYTKYARKYGDLLYKYKTQYADRLYKLKNIKHVEKLNGYWYLDLPWLDCNHHTNYRCSEDKKDYQFGMTEFFKNKIINKDLVKEEDFNLELLERLVDFRPCSYMAGVITDYELKKLPQFLYDLRKYFPDWYNQLKAKRPEVEELANKVTFKGKMAKLLTLQAGKVKVNTMIFDWDGTKIETTANQAHMWGKLEDAKIIIYPTDNSIVEIIDDDTVTDETEFV